MSATRLMPLLEAVERLGSAWADAASGADLSRTNLLAAHRALGAAQRCLDGLHAELAAAIAYESRAELGPDGLAKQHGHRSAAAMIAATTGSSVGDAKRLITVGQAAAPRTTLLGELLPAAYPVLAARRGRDLGAGRRAHRHSARARPAHDRRRSGRRS